MTREEQWADRLAKMEAKLGRRDKAVKDLLEENQGLRAALRFALSHNPGGEGT